MLSETGMPRGQRMVHEWQAVQSQKVLERAMSSLRPRVTIRHSLRGGTSIAK